MKSGILVVACCVSILGLSASSGRAQEGIGEKLGEKVDQAIGQITEEAREVAGRAREGFHQVRAMVDRMGVEGRVYARLHWDKALRDASISIDVKEKGVATLRGTVPNAAARAKAEELAGDTVDVERVINELTVAATPPAAPPASTRE